MKNALFVLLLIITACSSTQKQQTVESKSLEYGECKVGGNAINWAANYCMWLGDSDYYFDKHVQKCIKENERELTDAIECEKREYYKLKLCGHFINLGRIVGSKEACVDDKAKDKLWWKKVI